MEENLKFDADDIFCDDPAVLAALENYGIKYLFPWQRLVIANIMDAASGENPETLGKQIVLLPTGAGKSLCFQIPAILLDGPTLVIYPLLALMSDQQRRMIEGGMKCVVFRGGQTEQERAENFQAIKNGAKIIIANPEVLSNQILLEQLSQCRIAHVAIDEAHCVSEWGDSFRPAYLELGKVLEKLNVPVVTAFTATASPEVLSRIAEVLFQGEAHIVRSESDRPNIHYYVKKVEAKKAAALILAKTEPRPMIIFCGTRSRTEDMAQELNTAYGKDTAKFYHAGLERDEKTKIEEWFFNQKNAVLCATCAYGMGVDKKDIHTVIHLDSPLTAEAYIQEAGRGGRDGSVANAILLWSQEDRVNFSKYSRESRNAALMRFAETSECRRQVLLDALGAEQAVCSGCDICESKNFPRPRKTGKLKDFFMEYSRNKSCNVMPSWNVPNDGELALKFLKLADKYFSEESFENVFLKILNAASISFTGVNVWEHSSFVQIMNGLKSRRKIKILKWPWKGKIAIVNREAERKKRIQRRIRLECKKMQRKLTKNFRLLSVKQSQPVFLRLVQLLELIFSIS